MCVAESTPMLSMIDDRRESAPSPAAMIFVFEAPLNLRPDYRGVRSWCRNLLNLLRRMFTVLCCVVLCLVVRTCRVGRVALVDRNSTRVGTIARITRVCSNSLTGTQSYLTPTLECKWN